MSEQTELELLKERATKLGITFHPAIGVDKLREKVNAVLAPQEEADEIEEEEVVAKTPATKTKQQLKKEAGRLIRIRVTCMNPTKRDWQGEIFSVGNTLGEFKKYVPFNADDGWHVPYMIYEMIRDRKCQIFFNEKTNGTTIRKGKLIKEFGVEILPNLTPDELKELAATQAAAKSIG